MKLSELRSQLRFRLQEPQTTGRFADVELDSYINRGIQDLADRLELIQSTSDLSFAIGEASKPLPSDLLRLLRVTMNGTVLKTADPLALDTISSTWETTQGTPTHFFLQGMDLRLYPIPSAATTVKLTYIKTPAPLLADTDPNPLPSWTDEGVILYALYLARDSDLDERANNDWQKFEVWIQRAEARIRHRTVNPTMRVRVQRTTAS